MLPSLTLTILLSACIAGECDNEVLSTAVAPGGDIQAVLFSRDCGATTGFSTQLSILKVGDAPSEAGNAVIVDGQDALKVRWAGRRTLEVKRTEPGRIFKQEVLVKGVEILYAK